jgi:hypothetical protein
VWNQKLYSRVTRTCQYAPSCARWIQSTPSGFIPLRFILKAATFPYPTLLGLMSLNFVSVEDTWTQAVPCLRHLVACLSPRWPGFRVLVSPCGICGGQRALGQVFLRVLHLHLSMSFRSGSPYWYIIWRMSNRPVAGRSSETWSYSIVMNNNNVQIYTDVVIPP